MSFFRRIPLLLLATLLFGLRLHAQSANATLSGFVRDASGAFVSNASITVEALATHQRYNATTGSSGAYTVVDLPVGDYKVTTTATGFKIALVPKITLQTAQAASLDVTLPVGAVNEEVVVTTTLPQINTQDSSIGQVVEGRSIESVALNGRQFWQLVALTPGATYTPGGQGTRTGGASLRSSSVNVQINGTGFIFNGWSLDGVDITEYEQGGTNVQPNIDSLAEFKVLSANMPAAYGHTPNVVSATMKSGTNQFHGTVFEFLRNDAADAHNYFARTNKNILKRNQFGGVIGGPIRRDKLFFFSDFEETRQSSGITFANIVPSDAQRRGDYTGSGKILLDPTTKQPIPNNRITTISPQAQYFLQYLPTQAQANFSVPQKLTIIKGDGKIDATLSARDHLMGRYSITDNDEEDPNQFPALGTQSLHSRAQNIALTESHAFGAKLLNEAKFGLYKDIFLFGAVLPGTNYLSAASITGFEQTQLQASFPYITMSGYSAFNGSGQNNLPKSNRIRTWQYDDTVSYSSGKHSISTGLQFYHQRHTFFNGQGQEGIFAFNTGFTGDAFANFLLGLPNAVTRAYPLSLYGSTGNWWDVFVQDDWRPRTDLTLNIGMRYEHNPFYDGFNGQANAFDYDTGKVIIPTHNGGQLINPNAQPEEQLLYPLFNDRLESTESLGLPQSIHKTGPGVFAPRVGFAYRVKDSDNTVVRGAYGLFPIYFDSNMSLQWVKAPPFEIIQQINAGSTPSFTFGNPFNGQPLVAANPTPGAACAGLGATYKSCVTPAIWTSPVNLKHTYMHQYSLAVQHQIMKNLSIEVSYVGNNTIHNQLISTPDNVPAPGSGTTAVQLRRPYKQWGVFNLGNTFGMANYNALQAKVEKRYSNGFQVLGSYALSRCLDNGSSEAGPQTVGQIKQFYGPCDFNLTHVLTVSSVYTLPFGHGHRLLGNSNAFVNAALGGWEVAGIYTARSGLPYTPVIGSDFAANGTSGQFPDRVIGAGKGAILNPTPAHWFNTAAFKNPGSAQVFGNSGRNILTGDGLVQLDMTLKKTFPIHDAFNTEFRLEGFNVANHPTFANPGSTIGTSSAGVVTSTLNTNRTLQAAVKINF